VSVVVVGVRVAVGVDGVEMSTGAFAVD